MKYFVLRCNGYATFRPLSRFAERYTVIAQSRAVTFRAVFVGRLSGIGHLYFVRVQQQIKPSLPYLRAIL